MTNRFYTTIEMPSGLECFRELTELENTEQTPAEYARELAGEVDRIRKATPGTCAWAVYRNIHSVLPFAKSENFPHGW